MKKTQLRALQGMTAAIGAPLGWLMLRMREGASLRSELTEEAGLYLYMLAGTTAAFGVFGALLGEREERLLALNRQLGELSLTDALTGLRNARYFHTRLAEEQATSERTGEPLAVAVIDLDHFKQVNDRYGHPVGDETLANTARAIASVTRQGETEARVGGEEFALLLPNSTGEEAREVTERVRKAVQQTETIIPGGNGTRVRVTASAGVASTAELPGAGSQALRKAADDALYRAKREGRNRTVLAIRPARRNR